MTGISSANLPFQHETNCHLNSRSSVCADHQRIVTAFCQPVQMPDDFDLPDFDHLLATSAEEEWSSGEVLWHLLDTLTAEIHAQLDEAQLLVSDIENFLKTSAEAIKDHAIFRNELSTLRRLFNDVSETVPSLIAVCEAIGSDQLDLRAAAKDTELSRASLKSTSWTFSCVFGLHVRGADTGWKR